MNQERTLSQVGSLILVALVTAACGSVEIVNHPAPQLAVDTAWLDQAACTPSGGTSWTWDCKPPSPLATLSCDQVWAIDLLGGLTPSYPFAECIDYTTGPFTKPGFKQEGCMLPYLVTNVTFKDNTYRLVAGTAELQKLFAPVESADEALSYALAATNLRAYFGQTNESYFHYLAGRVEDTHVEETADGYLVHLFSPADPLCGCGMHTVDAIDVLVTREGLVKTMRSQHAYEFEACID
jgi:hypothetical protein